MPQRSSSVSWRGEEGGAGGEGGEGAGEGHSVGLVCCSEVSVKHEVFSIFFLGIVLRI